MKVPSIQSLSDTPHTPQAMLMPDHGTTPIRRIMERRTQAEDRGLKLSEPPDRALRVMSKARGNRMARYGASGVESRVAHREPSVVRVVRRIVA